ncbi:MAG: hypothetical protein II354_03165 [Firmicutes bacterium]|nr:hypothetical protein [Bacillota bacterium]
MKHLVIIIGTALLGCIIFEMMAGDGPDSLKTVSLTAMDAVLDRAYG